MVGRFAAAALFCLACGRTDAVRAEATVSPQGSSDAPSFQQSKKHLVAIYPRLDGATELYGGCALTAGEKLVVQAAGCCFEKVTLSWEHAVPAAVFLAAPPLFLAPSTFVVTFHVRISFL